MRATRTYLTGLGTAGGLVLGAALLFVVATAIVAFHGWPGASGGGRPSRQVVAVAPPPDAVARRVAQVVQRADAGRAGAPPIRPIAAVAHRRPASHPAARGAARRIAPTRRIVAATAPVSGTGASAPTRPVATEPRPTRPVHRSPTVPTVTVPVAVGGAGATSGAASGTTGVSRPVLPTTDVTTPTVPVVTPAAPAPPTNPVTTVTGTLGTTLGAVGTAAGHVGSGLGTTVGGIGSGTPLAPVTRGVGGVVSGVGSTAGTTLGGLGGLLG